MLIEEVEADLEHAYRIKANLGAQLEDLEQLISRLEAAQAAWNLRLVALF